MGDAGLLYVYAIVFVVAAAIWLFGDFFRSRKVAQDDDGLADRYTVTEDKKYAPVIVMGVTLFLFIEGGGLKLLFD